MTLRCVVASDDDIDKAGNLLADADFWDGDDGEVDGIALTEGGAEVDPVLRNVVVWENSTLAKNTSWRARAELQMNTWPNTRRENVFAQRIGGIATDSADATHTWVGSNGNTPYFVYSDMNLQCQAGDNWISDNTKLYASVDNATVLGIMFCYSYGTRHPYMGGHMQWIRKVADAAESAADAFYQAWSSNLTGTAPGLDPHKNYILRGIGYENAATAKASIGAFGQPQASAFKLFGPCWADFGLCLTVFMDDGIPVKGQSGFTAKTGSAGAADTPYVWLGFEEVGGPAGQAMATGNMTGQNLSNPAYRTPASQGRPAGMVQIP